MKQIQLTQAILISTLFNFENIFSKLFYDLEIEINSNKLPRFSCACHKCNIATRMAITNHETFKLLLKECSKFASSNNKSINLVKSNIEKKHDYVPKIIRDTGLQHT